MQRRTLIHLSLASAIGALQGCPKPIPGQDGGVTPSGVISVVNSVFDVIDVVLPIMRPFFMRFIPDGAAKGAVLTVVDVVVRVGGDWQSAARVYRERGGDSCLLFALSGALADALISLADALVDAGFGWGSEIEGLVSDLSLLLDRLIGRCAADGGVDAGALASSGRAGAAVQAALRGLYDTARARGQGLRQLPPLAPSSLN